MTRGGAGPAPATADELEIVAFERGRLHVVRARAASRTSSAASVDDVDDADRPHARGAPRATASTCGCATRWSAIDLDARTVTVARSRRRRPSAIEPFDQLVIATGATPIRPDLPGHRRARRPRRADARRRHRRCATTSTRPATGPRGRGRRRLHRARDGRGAARRAARRSRSSRPSRAADGTLDPDMGALVADAIRGLGIELRHRHARSTAFEIDDDGRVRGGRHRRRHVPGRPRRARASASSPNVDARRATPGSDRPDAAASRPTPRMATSADGVWAAGDCVETLPPRHATSRSRSRSARTRTSRAASSASTRPAATRRSRA